jgi:hypothetical protein
MLTLPNLLLISGTGRNVGKTTFVCRLIEQYKELPITAIKITSHLHDLSGNYRTIKISEDYQITEELQADESKDGRRMKLAGAAKVYYVQCKEEKLSECLEYLPELHQTISPVICEAGTLRKMIQPGLFLLLHNDQSNIKQSALELVPLADKMVMFDEGNFNISIDNIKYRQNRWQI